MMRYPDRWPRRRNTLWLKCAVPFHTGCLIDSSILAKFDAGDTLLDEELSGTFDDWDMPEEFNTLSGME